MLNKLKFFWQQSWLVIVGALTFGVLLAVTNAALEPRIEQNRIEKINRLMSGLVPEAVDFELVTEIKLKEPGRGQYSSTLYRAFGEQDDTLGWLFNAQGAGFADIISIIVGVGPDFQELIGFSVLSSNETPGFGDQIYDDYFQDQFEDAPAEELELVRSGDPQVRDREIVTITGATISSQAVVDIINAAMEQVRVKFDSGEFIGNGG